MAKYGSNVTTMSAPSLGGASHISGGIEDRSGALEIANTTNLIKDVGSTAVEAYKGYQLAEIEKETEAEIRSFTEREEPASIFTGLVKETANPSLVQFEEATKKYKTAVEQGRMSSTEFDTRIRDVLRKAVNKNPGMLKELSDHASTVLELSGVKNLIKDDMSDSQKIAKAQEEEVKYYMGLAKEFNIPLPRNSTGGIDMVELQKQTAIVQGEKATIEAADRQDKFTEDHFRSFGTTYATGKINQVTDLAIQSLNDPSIPYDKAITNINFMLDSVEQTFNSDPRIARIIDKPSVQATQKYLKDQIASVKANLKSYASKEEAATFLKNATGLLRDQQYQDISKVVNPQMLDVLTKLSANVGVADFISKQPQLKVELYNGITRIVEGLPTNDSSMYTKGVGNKPALSNQVVGELAKDAGKEDGEKSLTALSNTISSINTDISKLDTAEAFTFYHDYVKTLGSPASKEGLNKLDTQAVQKAFENVNDYTVITMKDMQNTINNYSDKGQVKISFDILQDGRLTVQTSSPNVSQELNKKYIVRINDSLAAYANLHGYSSTKEAAKSFYTQYQSFFAQGE